MELHDSSLDAIEIDCEEFKVDFGNTTDLSPRKQQQYQPHDYNHTSDIVNILSSNTPKLRLQDDSITNDLFQVTRNIQSPPRKKLKPLDLFTEDESEDMFYGINSSRLNNNKIEKLVQELEHEEFELDDQVRTRIFKGRFGNNQQTTQPQQPDAIEAQLGSFLDENKENNIPYPDPLKSIRNKEGSSIKKLSKGLNQKRRSIVNSGNNMAATTNSVSISFNGGSSSNNNINNMKSFIPTLRPLTNISTNYIDLRSDFASPTILSPTTAFPISPRRVFKPNHSKFNNNSKMLKTSIKYNNNNSNIYIVDSLTGLVSDATQFGTELNASNCEGFPLPEDTNEIVQIPTNDEQILTNKKQKMAIIKAFQNKYTKVENKPKEIGIRTGYYNNKEYEVFLNSHPHQSDGETNWNIKPNSKRESQRVKWADQLEW